MIDDRHGPWARVPVEDRELSDQVGLRMGHIVEQQVDARELLREQRDDVRLVAETEIPSTSQF
jgi:hypothetical protein